MPNGESSHARKRRWSDMQRIAEELGQPTLEVGRRVQDRRAGSSCTAIWPPVSASPSSALQIGQEAEQPDAVLIYGSAAMFYPARLPGARRGDHRDARAEREAPIRPFAALRAGLASSLCWLERRGEAAAILKWAASDRFEHILPAAGELTALVLYADAAAADRRPRRRRDPL